MKAITLSLFICLFTRISLSQSVIEWQNTIGGNGNDILRSFQQTSDGGYILGGTSTSSISGDKTESNFNSTNDYWVVKVDGSGNIQWQNTIGASDHDYIYSIQQTADGGYILGGTSYSGISGDKTENCLGSTDYWIVKLDALGGIEWQNTIGGNSVEDFRSIRQTVDGGYIIGGTSASGISGDKTENSQGYQDYWIVKLDSIGNIEWQNTIGGNSIDECDIAEQTSDGGYILGGMSESDISGDKTENNMGGYTMDYWVIKLDHTGNIEWQNTIGGDNSDVLRCIEQTSDNNYIVGGYSISNISGDKTENSIGSTGSVDYWILKLNSTGSILWQKTIGGDGGDDLASLLQTSDGGYILGGSSQSDSSGNKTENGRGNNDYWIVKLDSSGSIEWQNTFGGSDNDYLESVQQTNDGEYMAVGWSYSSISGDKTENSFGGFGIDFWMLKLTQQYSLITGKLFFDFNSNSIQDNGEPNIANRIVSEVNTGRFSFSNEYGFYSVSVLDSGNYSVLPVAQNYYQPVPASYNIYFPGLHLVDSLNDFAFQPAGLFNDLQIVLTPLSDFSPGFDASYQVDYANVGTTSIQGTVVFYPDPNISFVSGSVTPDMITADSIVWNAPLLSPFQTGSILLTVNVSVNAPIGSTISSVAGIEPVAGDADTANNYSTWDVIVTGSFDPNEMIVSMPAILVASTPYLEYIINFQNTGNDSAHNIKLLNCIPSTLNMSSFELVGSSDPVQLSFNPASSEMEFQFDNIMLPDSNVNESESHGFIRYRIKPIASLSVGDTIINNASIFFDFNAPVITNDALTKIVLSTGVNEVQTSFSGLRLYPNPASQTITIKADESLSEDAQILVYDIYGREIFRSQTQTGEQFIIDVSKFTAGFYLIHLNTNGKTLTTTIVKK